jgi:hypothetical protein
MTLDGSDEVPICLAVIPDKYEPLLEGKNIPALLEPVKALILIGFKGYIVAEDTDRDGRY